MGTWGSGLFENDIAEDVRTTYEDCLYGGMTDKQANDYTQKICSGYDPYDDRRLAVIALAVTQWKLGRIDKTVCSEALQYIQELSAESPLSGNGAISHELLRIKETLLSPPPKRVTMKKRKNYRCPWRVGDVFSFPITAENTNDRNLVHRCVFIQKVGETTWYPNHIVPILRAKISSGDSREIAEMEFIQISAAKFDPHRAEFMVASGGLTEEEYGKALERKRAEYSFDENGLLRQYQFVLAITSQAQLPDDFVYMGNQPVWASPTGEFTPKRACELPAVLPRELETTLVKDYLLYNKRQSDAKTNLK